MFDISRTIKDGAEALRIMGLDQAAQTLVTSAEDALVECEKWFIGKYATILEDAEAAIGAYQALENLNARSSIFGDYSEFTVVPRSATNSDDCVQVATSLPPSETTRAIAPPQEVQSSPPNASSGSVETYTPRREAHEVSTSDYLEYPRNRLDRARNNIDKYYSSGKVAR